MQDGAGQVVDGAQGTDPCGIEGAMYGRYEVFEGWDVVSVAFSNVSPELVQQQADLAGNGGTSVQADQLAAGSQYPVDRRHVTQERQGVTHVSSRVTRAPPVAVAPAAAPTG